MDNQEQNQPVELPNIAAGTGAQQIAPNVPTAPLTPVSPTTQQQQGPVQQALTLLMDTTKSPYQMSVEFAQLKEDYLARTYGVTIE